LEDYFLKGCKPITEWPINPNLGEMHSKLDKIGNFFTSRVKTIREKEDDNNE